MLTERTLVLLAIIYCECHNQKIETGIFSFNRVHYLNGPLDVIGITPK